MKTTFICLANSKKYGERCIAGIELEPANLPNTSFQIAQTTDRRPRWLRPVTLDTHGQVPAKLVENIDLLHVVELDTLRLMPHSYQSENCLFDKYTLRVLGKIRPCETAFDLMTEPPNQPLFGNCQNSILEKDIGRVNRSLTFVEVQDFQVRERARLFGDVQLRALFTYCQMAYDLPITDVKFVERYTENSDFLANCTRIYCTISLGIAYEGKYHKLVAGVIGV